MTAFPPFHVPYATGFFGAASPSASPLPWPSPPSCQARLPVGPLRALHYDAADFALCCGLVGCTFLKEGSTPRFNARISPNAGGLLRGCLGTSPDRTRTG